MTIIETLGISGCILASIYTATGFSVYVRSVNGYAYDRKMYLIYFLLGLLACGSLSVYAYLNRVYILAFSQMLGLLNYMVVLVQVVWRKNYKAESDNI